MPIPELMESESDAPLELTMGAGEWEILPGVRTSTIGFNGPYLGPTVRLRDGQNVPIIYRNNLSEAVAVHGHGLHVPGELDGGPQREIEPGGVGVWNCPSGSRRVLPGSIRTHMEERARKCITVLPRSSSLMMRIAPLFLSRTLMV